MGRGRPMAVPRVVVNRARQSVVFECPLGNRMESEALTGTLAWGPVESSVEVALVALVPLVLMVAAAVIAIEVIRRRGRSAMAVFVIAVGATVAAQVVKRVFGRPQFIRDASSTIPAQFPEVKGLSSGSLLIAAGLVLGLGLLTLGLLIFLVRRSHGGPVGAGRAKLSTAVLAVGGESDRARLPGLTGERIQAWAGAERRRRSWDVPLHAGP